MRFAFACLLLLTCSSSVAGEQPPNVLVFAIAGLTTDDLASSEIDTPRIDEFLRTGVVLERAYAHSDCRASRALLLTGRHPQRVGLANRGQRFVRMGEVTLGEALSDAGYRTALGGELDATSPEFDGPTSQGFAEVVWPGASVEQFMTAPDDAPFFVYLAFDPPRDAKLRDYLAGVDAHIGTILAHLDDAGLTEDTLVLLVGDVSVKSLADELRAPVALALPRRLPSGVARAQAAHVGDLFPTVLELCGVPLPAVALDGRSLVGALDDAEAPEPHAALHWQWRDEWAVQEGAWRLVGDDDPTRDVLVDLSTPAAARANQAADEPALHARLRTLHDAWSAEVSPAANLARVRAALTAAGEAPDGLRPFGPIVPSTGRVFMRDTTLYFAFTADSTPTLSFPRLFNPIARARLLGGEELALRQDNRRWWVPLPETLSGEVVIALDVVGIPKVSPNLLTEDEAGALVLPAHEAQVFGEKLCYEPQPHKNTLGYWVNPADWARWTVEVSVLRTFEVDVLQGCGKGHGGSEVDVHVADQVLRFTVEDTGHFQAFKRRKLGQVTLPAGEHYVEIRPCNKANGAVCDVREVRLSRVE